jgi:hypothetical protein
MALAGPGMLGAMLHDPLALSILGLSIGWVVLVAALLVLYVWFCVYWWRGGRPVAEPPGEDERRERPRRRAA